MYNLEVGIDFFFLSRLIYIKMAHLNSAEGIQNMCATQIMTKSKSLRTGFSSQVAQ